MYESDMHIGLALLRGCGFLRHNLVLVPLSRPRDGASAATMSDIIAVLRVSSKLALFENFPRNKARKVAAVHVAWP